MCVHLAENVSGQPIPNNNQPTIIQRLYNILDIIHGSSPLFKSMPPPPLHRFKR